MFTPTLQMSNKGQPLEKRIENCRGRITELEKQLAKERRLLSLLFAEERLSQQPEIEQPRKLLTAREIEGQELLAECREVAKKFGLDFPISEGWSNYHKEQRRLGVSVDIMDKAEYWLEQLKSKRR
ncbi:hypothetical protein VZ148_09725 [Enterobacter hormaechei]|uniref:hypothetical protein n=1 Tax=Enterobacter hormaechei TaxID=158836 RepID=UPI0028674788|nr:hypothetical protein [Enterobacter hormaechei]ELD3465303.1 hypothetical protein [Enterobacter hormaechei]MED5730965.1 hypothetical protein [Enterobacter hormaechei]HDR1981821.1 hypothetical protein [Enterobacter hormaechei]